MTILPGFPTWGVISLVVVMTLFALAILLVIVEVLRDPELSVAAKLAWVAGLVITTFFAVTIYFAQGHTGRLARIASYLLVLALIASMALIAAVLLL